MALAAARHLAVVVPLGLVMLGGQGGEAGQGGGADTFQGTCQFSGKLRQRPPLTNTPQAGSATARARGLCAGASARYFARAAGTLSCGGGSAAGKGFIQLRGERIRFTFSEVRGPGAAAIRLEGADGGSATGEARASEDEDPVEIAERCGAEGLRSVRIHIDLATTPSISG
jgi:hypothetical protein